MNLTDIIIQIFRDLGWRLGFALTTEQGLDMSTLSKVFKHLLKNESEEKIGWHYTSYGNWKKIKRQGLKLYSLNSWIVASLAEYKVVRMTGIFIWKKKPNKHPGGRNHVGNILYQLATKGDFRVCLLEVRYLRNSQLRNPEGRRVELAHTGNFSVDEGKPWIYHKNRMGLVLTKPVPPESIRLLEVYDIRNLTAPVNHFPGGLEYPTTKGL